MDTAQRFPDYDPAADLLLLTRSDARDRGLFYNDPTYPPPPVDRFADPVLNLGPDADRYRDPKHGRGARRQRRGWSGLYLDAA